MQSVLATSCVSYCRICHDTPDFLSYLDNGWALPQRVPDPGRLNSVLHGRNAVGAGRRRGSRRRWARAIPAVGKGKGTFAFLEYMTCSVAILVCRSSVLYQGKSERQKAIMAAMSSNHSGKGGVVLYGLELHLGRGVVVTGPGDG